MDDNKNTHLYGPVPSRRLGMSLGVDLVPFKTCTYNCIYCQLGPTSSTVAERKEYTWTEEVITQVQEWIEKGGTADYITMAGSGEPTLHSGIGTIIREVKKCTDIPVAVITNGALLWNRQVQEDIIPSDLAVPSLDAGSARVFQEINRPDSSIDFEQMVKGIMDFSVIFKGELWLEVFLVPGINTGKEDLADLKIIIDEIAPHKIHLNTAARPPAEDFVKIASEEMIKLAQKILGTAAEVVAPFRRHAKGTKDTQVTGEEIIEILKRRPCSLMDIALSLDAHPNETMKYLDMLLQEGKIYAEKQGQDMFYRIVE